MAIKCKELYRHTQQLDEDDVYYYNIATVLEPLEYSDVYIELQKHYDEGTGNRSNGYTLIQKGDIPEAFSTVNNDGVEFKLEHMDEEVELDPEDLGNYNQKSWVNGVVVPKTVADDFES